MELALTTLRPCRSNRRAQGRRARINLIKPHTPFEPCQIPRSHELRGHPAAVFPSWINLISPAPSDKIGCFSARTVPALYLIVSAYSAYLKGSFPNTSGMMGTITSFDHHDACSPTRSTCDPNADIVCPVPQSRLRSCTIPELSKSSVGLGAVGRVDRVLGIDTHI